MVTRARVATKFFVYGLLIGLLFAPRPGKETRAAAIACISRRMKERVGLESI